MWISLNTCLSHLLQASVWPWSTLLHSLEGDPYHPPCSRLLTPQARQTPLCLKTELNVLHTVDHSSIDKSYVCIYTDIYIWTIWHSLKHQAAINTINKISSRVPSKPAFKVLPFLKYQQLDVLHMKRSWAALAHADLARNPSTEQLLAPGRKMSNMGFQWLESRVTLKPAGAACTSHVMQWTPPWQIKRRERRANWRHMRQKRAATTYSLFWTKC